MSSSPSAKTASTRSWRWPCSRSRTFRRSAKKAIRSGECERLQRQSRARLQQYADHAERCTAQGIGVAAAGGLLVDGEEAHQGVQLVGQRHGRRRRLHRHVVGGPLRTVVPADRIGDLGVQPFLVGVVAAHHALQFREFTHHAGDQVGLAEPRSLLGEGLGRAVIADEGGEFAGQGHDPLHPLVHGPELGVEGDALQLLQPVFQLGLQVLVPEEAAVGEARRQHLGVARRDQLAAVRRLDIGHGDEVRDQEAGLGIAHREILLVGAHGGADHLRRQVQEIRVHVAQDRRRPFGEPGHLVQQALVLDQFEIAREAEGARRVHDPLLALLGIEDDEVGGQAIGILVEVARRARPGRHP